MKVASAVCPRCGQKLSVKGPDNVTSGTVTCPKCSTKISVTFTAASGGGDPAVRQQAAAYDGTLLPGDVAVKGMPGGQTASQQGGQDNNDETQLPPAGTFQNPGMLAFNGQTYKLTVGQNIVGRSAPGSLANVQILTNDIYCSRQQLIITVLRMPNGSLRTFVRTYMAKNKTYVNNQLLREGEEVVLKDGDRIRMADTTVVFVAG